MKELDLTGVVEARLVRHGFVAKHIASLRDLPNFGDCQSDEEVIALVLEGEPERLWIRRVAALPSWPAHIAGAFLEGERRAWRSGLGSRYPTRRWEEG